MPKSVERDFYIWKFLKEPATTKKDTIEVAKLIFHINSKLQAAYKKKSGLRLHKIVARQNISKNRLGKYKKIISKLQKSGDFFNNWINLNIDDKLNVYSLGGLSSRVIIDRDLTKEIYNKLQKNKLINQVIFRANREHLNRTKSIILNTSPINNSKISYKNLILLGFKNLRLGNLELASKFFYRARFNAKDRFYADRAIFWQYMSIKDINLLNKLAYSYDFNIYKFIALDLLNKPYPFPSQLNVKKSYKSAIDISNPIEWARLKKKIFSSKYNLFSLATKYNSTKSIGHYSYILSKASRDTKQYFPTPYREILSRYPVNRQALIYAIARQESRFIPASVSTSFAVGMMQFMPFLVKHVAKVRGENIALEDMFKPEVSLRFANTHLNYLNKYLYHPLFVAYAYNAGIGYTRKLIRKNIFKSGTYEPYISLEMVGNEQANHYGKKVLANYVIYKKLLGSPIKITTLLKQLDKPTLTDRFR